MFEIATDLKTFLEKKEIDELSNLFSILANPSRIQILHILTQYEELSVLKMSTLLGIKPQALSNQLRKLSDMKIIKNRKEGTFVYYRVDDPCVSALLQHGYCLLSEENGEGRNL